MEINILLFLTVLSYSFLVSQSFMYMIALRNVQMNLSAPHYIQMRKLLDKNFRKKYSLIVYTALASATCTMILCSTAPQSILFISICLAWLMLVTDVLITIKGNMPINNIINSWSEADYPSDWEKYRSKWLFYFSQRQIVVTTGYTALIFALVFG